MPATAETGNGAEMPAFTDAERAAVHRAIHQIDEIYHMFSQLKPLLDAYQRGGMLGARTAMRKAGR